MRLILALLLTIICLPCDAGDLMVICGVQEHMAISVTGQQFGPDCEDVVSLSAAKPEQQSTLTCKSNTPYKVTAITIPQAGDPANIQVSYFPQSGKILSLSHDTPLSNYTQKTSILWGQPTLNRGEDCVLDYKLKPDNNLLYGDSVVAIVRYQIEARGN